MAIPSLLCSWCLCNNPHIYLPLLPSLYFYLNIIMKMKDTRGARFYAQENTNQLFFPQKARGKGVLHVRVIVKGLGPGRKVGVGVSFPYFILSAVMDVFWTQAGLN